MIVPDVALITTHISPAKGYGGVAESGAALARAWGRCGYPVEVWASDGSVGGRLAVEDVALPRSVTVVLGRSRWFERWGFSVAALWQIPAVCRRVRVVYINGIATWPTSLAAVSCWLLGRPFIVAPRGGLLAAHVASIKARKPHKWLFYRFVTLPTLRGARRLHVTSVLEAEGVAALLPGCQSVVIANGVDLTTWQLRPPRPHSEGRVLCYVGRLSLEKGIAGFLRLWLRFRGPGDRFLIAGSGEGRYGRTIEALAREGGAAVTLLGYLDRAGVRAVLAESDFLVLPSGLERSDIRENFGNTVVEAFALGRPVLVRRGLAWDHLEAEGLGFLFDDGDESVGAVLRRIRALDPDTFAAMADAARRYAQRHFDLAETAETLWALLTDSALLSGGEHVACRQHKKGLPS